MVKYEGFDRGYGPSATAGLHPLTRGTVGLSCTGHTGVIDSIRVMPKRIPLILRDQVFDKSFEEIWKSFDEVFRAKLLGEIRQMGSLHRLTGDDERINTEYSKRFYDALEETLGSGKFIPKWKKALVGPVPKSMDELSEIFRLHSIYPMHAFYLLLVFIHEHPLRGFFSGRDVPLPFNTLTLKFQQLLSDPLPTGVDYELDRIRLDRCPGLAYDSETLPSYQTEGVSALPLQGDGGLGVHPQHHRWDLIWVWHFNSPPEIFGQ